MRKLLSTVSSMMGCITRTAHMYWVPCSDVPIRLICKEERMMRFYITLSNVTTGHVYIIFLLQELLLR